MDGQISRDGIERGIPMSVQCDRSIKPDSLMSSRTQQFQDLVNFDIELV